MNNLELWSNVEKTNPSHTKKVTFGRGFTAIDPYHQIKCATEQFGPAGKGWGWEVIKIMELNTISSIGVLVRLWHGSEDRYIEQWGQGSLYTDKGHTKPDNDVLKKATTDGITKCLSYLGFNADVFLGKFDDNKYVQQMNNEFNHTIAYTEKQKKAFDYFIDKGDSLGIYLLQSSESVTRQAWTDLFNSFPDGKKTAMKESVRKLEAIGAKEFNNINSCIQDGDDTGLSENLEGATEQAISMLKSRLGDDAHFIDAVSNAA